MRLVLVSFTLIYRCMSIIIETLHDQSFSLTSEESLRDSKPPDTGCPRTKGQESVYETCACIIYRCMSIIIETLHDQSFSLTSEESLRDSKPPDTGCLRTKGQESVYETCACIIHTNLLSYMCISH